MNNQVFIQQQEPHIVAIAAYEKAIEKIKLELSQLESGKRTAQKCVTRIRFRRFFGVDNFTEID